MNNTHEPMAVIQFPPPPKTVDVWNPHLGENSTVLSYGHTKDGDVTVQRVRWNPAEGRWEVNPETARWQKQTQSASGWVLATIWPEHVAAAKYRRTREQQEAREEALNQRIAALETTVTVLWAALYGDQSVEEVAAEQAMSKIAL